MAKNRAYSRRRFLKASGIVAGGLATAPVMAAFDSVKHSSALQHDSVSHATPLKIGLLLPQSSLYPTLANNFQNGLQLYVAKNQTSAGLKGSQIQFVSEDVGALGGYRVEQKVLKLLTEDKVKLVAGVVNPSTLPALNKLFAANNAILIANSTGENVSRQNTPGSNVIHNSLGQWQANRALGHWAAAHIGHKAVICTSIYEGGYDLLYAFQLGFEEAGGQVVGKWISGSPATQAPLPSLTTLLSENRPDFVFAAYSGQQAIDFVRDYAASGAKSVPLLGSRFMVDDGVLAATGAAAANIISAATWAKEGHSAENTAFVTAYTTQTSVAPDSYAMLGYETGRLIAETLHKVGGDVSRIGQAGHSLANAHYTSLRGATTLDIAHYEQVSAVSLCKVQQQNGRWMDGVTGQVAAVPQTSAALRNLLTSAKTGWSSPYMCM